MSGSTSKSEATQLENTTYNILAALGRDADFLYDTIGTYIKDAQNANRSDLVDILEHNKTRKTKTSSDVKTSFGKGSKGTKAE